MTTRKVQNSSYCDTDVTGGIICDLALGCIFGGATLETARDACDLVDSASMAYEERFRRPQPQPLLGFL